MRILKHVRGHTMCFGGEPHRGWLPEAAATPPDTPQETVQLDLAIIEQGEGSYLLEWTSPSRAHWGDMWHPSLEDALAQAEEAFGIAREQWSEGAPGERGRYDEVGPAHTGRHAL